ncbi:MAG: SAM-dependent methyltransferase [Lachnospiraceae bacterium]|nr:SAM-dependent methyltransferase [Lachnospiraceae bacterium]MDD3660088.1 SAM-dependent methyltransferase [Lachnospiraceae bacterium]
MEKLQQLLEKHIAETMYQLVASNPVKGEETIKLKLRPILQKDHLLYQASSFIGTQVIHKNYSKNDAVTAVCFAMETKFRQLEIHTTSHIVTVLISKKGKMTVKEKVVTGAEKEIDLTHNRKKKYLLEEGKAVGFLIDLGIQEESGKILKSKYDKFRQINRFLEFIEDIIPELDKEQKIHILDFGCGKSYLTFAMYHFLKNVKGLDISITGLDLKKDVIEHCNRLAEKYEYQELHFLHGDIADYSQEHSIDMVVTLHACDTATDHALQKAVDWNAKVILSVPCCQHELNRQIKCTELDGILKYGLIKERMSALITDAIRAELLTEQGYSVQILEFIDMEHTPKNILIRAVKTGRVLNNKREELEKLFQFLHVDPALNRLLRNE